MGFRRGLSYKKAPIFIRLGNAIGGGILLRKDLAAEWIKQRTWNRHRVTLVLFQRWHSPAACLDLCQRTWWFSSKEDSGPLRAEELV
jgi:hypothetical protein